MDCGTDAKAVRPIEQYEAQIDQAMKHLSDSIVNLRRAFAPVMEDDKPEPTAETSKASIKNVPDSHIQRTIESFTFNIHKKAEEINMICTKSRI